MQEVGKAGTSKGQVTAQIAADTDSPDPLHGSEQLEGMMLQPIFHWKWTAGGEISLTRYISKFALRWSKNTHSRDCFSGFDKHLSVPWAAVSAAGPFQHLTPLTALVQFQRAAMPFAASIKTTIPWGFAGEDCPPAILHPGDPECRAMPTERRGRWQRGQEGEGEPTGITRETPSGLCSFSKASLHLLCFYFMPFPHRKMIFTVNIMNACQELSISKHIRGFFFPKDTAKITQTVQ